MILLPEGELGAVREHPAGMRLHDLHGAVSPAEALLLVAGEMVGRQAVAEALAAVHGAIALLHQAQAQLGVLGDAPGRPAAQLLHQVAAHQGHRAVLDDGVVFVAQAHADVEEAGIFPVEHFLEAVAGPVAVVLRRLHVADLGVVEMRYHGLQPVRPHHVVAVDDSDHLGVGCGLGQHIVQCTSLEALHHV